MTTRNVMIESLGVAVPSTFQSTGELIRSCRVPFDFDIEEATGIARVPTLPAGKFAQDLAERAVEDCLARSRYTPAEVDLLIGCSLIICNEPGAILVEPTVSSLLKRRMGFTRALTLDVSCACAGLFAGLRVAEAFLRTGAAKRALIFSGEYVTHGIPTAQAEIDSPFHPCVACLTCGDSGAALMLELGDDPRLGLIDLQLYTLGRYSGHCVVKPSERAPGGMLMRTDTVRLSLMINQQGMDHFERAFKKSARSPSEFDFFVPHQASAAALYGVMREANKRFGEGMVTEENLLDNLASRGNTVTTTHFMAIHDAIRGSRIRDGNRLFLSTVASGATLGSAAYHLDDLPSRIVKSEPVLEPRIRTASDVAVSAWRQRLERSVRIEALASAASGEVSRPTSIALAKAAAQKCLGRSKITRGQIELLIFAGVYRSEFILEPPIASFLARELRMNDHAAEASLNTLAVDLNDSSNGFLSACQVAARLIESGQIQRAMVIVAEGDVPHTDGSPRVEPFGSAAVLEVAAQGGGFSDFGFYQFPTRSSAIESKIVLQPEGGAALFRRTAADLRGLFTHSVAQALRLYFEANPNARRSTDYLILPDVEIEYQRTACQALELPPHCRIVCADRERDLFTSALPHALEQVRESDEACDGKRALLVSAGADLKVACAGYEL